MKKIILIALSALLISSAVSAKNKDNSVKEAVSNAAETVSETAKDIADDVSKEAKKSVRV